MPNTYVNKVNLADGTSIIDISDTTATAADVASGKYFYTAAGAKTEGTASAGSSVVITDTTDSHGGTIRTITGVVISGTKQITSNGTGIDVAEYATVDVAVPGASLQAKTNINPTTASQTIEADNGYDGLSSVQINAMPNGSVTAPSTISGTSATVSTGTNTLTLSKTVSVTPSVTTAGYISSGTAGNSSVSLTASVTTQAAQTIHPSTTDQSIASGRYLTGAQTVKAVTTTNLTADNIKSGVVVKIGDSTDDDCVTSVTGTYSGGGTSKNTQILQSTSRTTATSLTKVTGDMTVSKTGTYDVYWSGTRTNTSSSYTWGTRLYIGGTGYGTENTTWSNNVQSNHLTSVSLTANQKLSVYARGRGGNYYACVPMLVIVEN